MAMSLLGLLKTEYNAVLQQLQEHEQRLPLSDEHMGHGLHEHHHGQQRLGTEGIAELMRQHKEARAQGSPAFKVALKRPLDTSHDADDTSRNQAKLVHRSPVGSLGAWIGSPGAAGTTPQSNPIQSRLSAPTAVAMPTVSEELTPRPTPMNHSPTCSLPPGTPQACTSAPGPQPVLPLPTALSLQHREGTPSPGKQPPLTDAEYTEAVTPAHIVKAKIPGQVHTPGTQPLLTNAHSFEASMPGLDQAIGVVKAVTHAVKAHTPAPAHTDHQDAATLCMPSACPEPGMTDRLDAGDPGNFSDAEEAIQWNWCHPSFALEEEGTERPDIKTAEETERQGQEAHQAGHVRFGGMPLLAIAESEAAASAVTEQELDSLDALGCLVSKSGRYLIKFSTVLLGRNTDSKGEVDVDLSGEGQEAKGVSRRQAYLTLRLDGMWAVTNAGRGVLCVEGRELPPLGVALLPHLGLIQVGGVHLLFMANRAAVDRVAARTARAAQLS